MKSTETYGEIRNILEPWCKLNGFKKMRTGVPAWCKPLGEKILIFWFQVERYGWSTNLGSSFYVEFQLSESSKIGSWGHETTRKRLRHFLTDDEFVNFRRFRDKVVASLTPLPADSNLKLLTDLTLESESYAYDTKGDIWFRYYTVEDVRYWANLILPIMPRAISKLAEFPPGYRVPAENATPWEKIVCISQDLTVRGLASALRRPETEVLQELNSRMNLHCTLEDIVAEKTAQEFAQQMGFEVWLNPQEKYSG